MLVCGPVRLYVTGDCINSFAELDALVEPVRKLGPQIGFMTCHPTEGEFPFFDGCAKMVKRIGLKIGRAFALSVFREAQLRSGGMGQGDEGHRRRDADHRVQPGDRAAVVF